MTRTARKTLAECRPTAKQKREIERLAQAPDSGTDFSDLPELTEKFWQNAVPNPFYRPVKKQVTLRIDADILVWLRQQGPQGYQSRLNALLRNVMLRDLEARQKRA
ncbi:MAG: BrnA antitoxin family protein [Acidobacteriaceae bacterium]